MFTVYQVKRNGFALPMLSLEPRRSDATATDWDTTLKVTSSAMGNADFRMSDGNNGYTLRSNGAEGAFQVMMILSMCHVPNSCVVADPSGECRDFATIFYFGCSWGSRKANSL